MIANQIFIECLLYVRLCTIGNTKMKRYGTALKKFRLKKVGRGFYFKLAVVVHKITHYSNRGRSGVRWREVRERALRFTLRNQGRLPGGDSASVPPRKMNRCFPGRQAKKWQHRQRQEQVQRCRAMRQPAVFWELEQ